MSTEEQDPHGRHCSIRTQGICDCGWLSTPPAKQPPYDSAPETHEHIRQVRRRLYNVVHLLHLRGKMHDLSKFGPEEKPLFDRMTPLLKGLTYGSGPHKEALQMLGPALAHHYAHNTHHPEHWPTGIAGMCLLDLIEMYCDWAAAVMRHADGSLSKSIDINERRFDMAPQLAAIFRNTLERHGDFSTVLP